MARMPHNCTGTGWVMHCFYRRPRRYVEMTHTAPFVGLHLQKERESFDDVLGGESGRGKDENASCWQPSLSAIMPETLSYGVCVFEDKRISGICRVGPSAWNRQGCNARKMFIYICSVALLSKRVNGETLREELQGGCRGCQVSVSAFASGERFGSLDSVVGRCAGLFT